MVVAAREDPGARSPAANAVAAWKRWFPRRVPAGPDGFGPALAPPARGPRDARLVDGRALLHATGRRATEGPVPTMPSPGGPRSAAQQAEGPTRCWCAARWMRRLPPGNAGHSRTTSHRGFVSALRPTAVSPSPAGGRADASPAVRNPESAEIGLARPARHRAGKARTVVAITTASATTYNLCY